MPKAEKSPESFRAILGSFDKGARRECDTDVAMSKERQRPMGDMAGSLRKATGQPCHR